MSTPARFITRLAVTALLPLYLAACAERETNGHFVGYVHGDWTYVSTPSSGLITARHVDAGHIVTAEQLLFELETVQQAARLYEAEGRYRQAQAQAEDISTGPREPELKSLEAQYTKAKATYEQAKSIHLRVMPLVASGAESKARGDEVEASLKVSRASLTEAEQAIRAAKLAGRDQAQVAAKAAADATLGALNVAQALLDERKIRSTISGRVEEVFYEVGEYAMTGAPMAAILAKDKIKVRFFVPQASLPTIQTGQKVSVSYSGSQSDIQGTISFIASSAEYAPPVIYTRESREKLVFMVEATLDHLSLTNNNNDPSIGTITHLPLNPGLPVDINLL